MENDNAVLRRIIFDSGAGQTLLKHYESVTATKESAVDCTMLSLVPCVLAILSAGYRKPDPRFVEVGKIEWPEKLTHISHVPPMDSTLRACGYYDGYNNAIDACKAAALKAGEKGRE